MVDVGKHIDYWRNGAQEDWAVAKQLLGIGRVRHSLFFAHLALEKLLKGLVCKHVQDLAPRIHNLSRLAELAGVCPSHEHSDILAEMNPFQAEGRYPESLTQPPTLAEAHNYLVRAEEVFQWLLHQF